MKTYDFKKALPVWEQGKEREKNYNLAFRCIIPKNENTRIALTASNMYQMFINGTMIAEGPARAGHGYYRVDEIDISGYLTREENIVVIYVDGYYVSNFYLIKQPAFLCAEILVDGEVIAATGQEGFAAKYHSDRLQKVSRYSYQRTFCEVYEYDETYKNFECDANTEFAQVELVTVEEKRFIERGVPYPAYEELRFEKLVSRGTVEFKDEVPDPVRDRVVVFDNPEQGYFLEEQDIISGDEVDKGVYTVVSETEEAPENTEIPANAYAIYALSGEKTGFLELEVECTGDVQLMAGFDEILLNKDVNIHRINTIGVVIWKLKKGSYTLLTNEPYSMKYLKLINKSEGALLKVKSLRMKEFAFDYKDEGLQSSNEKLNKIYEAAVDTFRQNTLDIYMDCPSRERAGWLCDSFFTSRVEYALTGKSLVEKNFLENFIYSDGVPGITPEMLAMCYPSDFDIEKQFIPQWAMWYVIELGEYLERSGDRELVDAAKEKMETLLGYFRKFENADGLLENLESWQFLEWSAANTYVNGVNYPTNMLYAKMLKAFGALYGASYTEKAEHIMVAVRRQSFFDGFFHDHAVRGEDGTLSVVKEHISETCQYYAFFTETATPETFPELWERMLNEFGPDRVEKGLWKEIAPSNAFIGYYLRLELLSRVNEKEKLLENIEGFFGHMAETTGTLWEHNQPYASCNHGFASHVILWLK